MSELGVELPFDFEYAFNSLWKMSDKEQSEIATSDAATVNTAYGSGLISKETATKELISSSRITGRFTNLTEEDVEKAKEDDKNEPPLGIMPEETLPELENENIDLTTKSPELAKEQESKQSIRGREQSISSKEQESQDEIEGLPSKKVDKVIQPGLSKIRQNWIKSLQEIKEKFFTKDQK